MMIVSQDALEFQTIEIKVQAGAIQELTPEYAYLTPSDEPINFTTGVIRRIMIPGGYRLFKICKYE